MWDRRIEFRVVQLGVEQVRCHPSVSPIPGIRFAINKRLDLSFTLVHGGEPDPAKHDHLLMTQEHTK